MTTDTRLSGATILIGCTIANFVAQFLPFQDGHSYLTHATNTDVYTGLVLGGDSGTGWDQHPNVWWIFVALGAAWLVPAIRRNEHWHTWGPLLTVVGLWFTSTDSAPLRTTGGGLAFAAFLVSIWGAWRAWRERKAEEAAAVAARIAEGEKAS